MFSVPFQQTARYVKEHSEEITTEEAEAIRGILDFDHLAELYNPEISDAVKWTYKDKADNSANMDYPAFEKLAIEHSVRLTQGMLKRMA